MNRLKHFPLDFWLSLPLILLGVAAVFDLYVYGLPETSLLWRHGVTTHGVISDVGYSDCGRYGRGQPLSVRFTDQTGQVHTSTFNNCVYLGPHNTTPGSSITIVYLPDDPTKIAPSGELPFIDLLWPSMTVLLLLLTLILLPFWIRKRIRKASRQDQQRQIEISAE